MYVLKTGYSIKENDLESVISVFRKAYESKR